MPCQGRDRPQGPLPACAGSSTAQIIARAGCIYSPRFSPLQLYQVVITPAAGHMYSC